MTDVEKSQADQKLYDEYQRLIEQQLKAEQELKRLQKLNQSV